LILEVWSNDSHGRNSLIGYGCAFIPFKTGKINMPVLCWRPSEILTNSLRETLLGCTPEFLDKSAVYTSEEKFGIYGMSEGHVNVELDIIMKDFEIHGIEVK
jgi:hypothetical protein